MIRSVDLFAGAGGLSLGMEAAGIEAIAAVERERDFVSTLRHHFPDAHVESADVRDLDFSEYRGRANLVIGGPPCQPFSSGGLRAGASDERDMVPEFLRAVAEVQPSAFLMENVRGLVVGSRRAYFERLIDALQRLGYHVSWKVLNAADYGVPQKRMRLFVVGTRAGQFTFPEASHGSGMPKAHVAVRDALPEEQVGEPNTSKVTYAKRPDLRPSPYHGQLFNGGGRPLNLEEPAPTILASAGGNKTHFIDTEHLVPPYHSHLMSGGRPKQGKLPGARRLTVEESAIIQTFPLNYHFAGSRSSQYTQIGNAVPPKLAEVLGRALIAHLENVSQGSSSDGDSQHVYVQTSLFSSQTIKEPMPSANGRNVHVEHAVENALERIDDFISEEELHKLPSAAHRRACDAVLADRSKSARVAGLFFAFYRLEDQSWDLTSVPTGTRGKYGDKRLCDAIKLRSLTLASVDAFAENLGWKGDVHNVDLTVESHFKDWVAAVKSATTEEQKRMADYMASKFAQSRVVQEPMPPVGEDVLTFVRAKELFYSLLKVQSNGYIQQFLIAALLYEFRQNQGIDVQTHHPNASDTYDGTAGDIEEIVEGQLIRAYEVTMRPDWQNRITAFRDKMDKVGLNKYTIIAAGINADQTWSVPAKAALTLEEYGRDIAVIDIEDVVNFLAAELTAPELRRTVNHAFDYLTNQKLCGKHEYIEAYRDAVDEWLDEIGEEAE